MNESIKKRYTCKNCGKTTKFHNHFEYHFSWSRHDLCPMCYDKTSLAKQDLNDELIISTEFNPVDLYWNYVTSKYLT